jgi:hypothetical protein
MLLLTINILLLLLIKLVPPNYIYELNNKLLLVIKLLLDFNRFPLVSITTLLWIQNDIFDLI